MKISYTASMSKNELTAIKDFSKKAAHHFGEHLSDDALEMKVSQRMSVKFNAGNVLAFFNLKDTYEVSIDMEIDESYVTEYLELAARALPLVGGIVNIVKELETLNAKKFEVLESNIETLDTE